MFIVKAMRPNHTPDPVSVYTVFQGDYYEVGPCEIQTDEKNWVRPQAVLTLYEKAPPLQPASVVARLDVGLAYQQGQFDTVYVMNDRGKTIDTIQAQDG